MRRGERVGRDRRTETKAGAEKVGERWWDSDKRWEGGERGGMGMGWGWEGGERGGMKDGREREEVEQRQVIGGEEREN